VGSRLVEYLSNTGEKVLAVGRHDTIDWDTHLGQVYYCIGVTADFRQRTYDTVRSHVHVLQDVLQKAHFESFLYLSSTRVYQYVMDTQEGSNLTVNPNRTDDLYNISKLMGESLCLAIPNPFVRVARISNIITSHSPVSSINYFDAILDSIIKTKHLTLQTTVGSEKDYIDLDDVVLLLVQIAEQGRERIYNVARGENTSSAMLLEIIREQLAFDFDVDVASNSPSQRFPPINTQRIVGEFGFVPKSMLQTVQERLKTFFEKRDLHENPG
jgi:nucleoside-diphosphate-sugar epimerase